MWICHTATSRALLATAQKINTCRQTSENVAAATRASDKDRPGTRPATFQRGVALRLRGTPDGHGSYESVNPRDRCAPSLETPALSRGLWTLACAGAAVGGSRLQPR